MQIFEKKDYLCDIINGNFYGKDTYDRYIRQNVIKE